MELWNRDEWTTTCKKLAKERDFVSPSNKIGNSYQIETSATDETIYFPTGIFETS